MASELSIHYPDPAISDYKGFSLKRTLSLLKSFGPAGILASISIGAGESVLAVRVGAWAGYSLLWIVFLAGLVKAGLITYLIGRYTILSGELISSRIAKAPGPKYWCIVFIGGIALLDAPFFISAIAAACGGLLNYLTGSGTPVVWGSILVGITLMLGALVSFKNLENHLVVICGVLVTATAFAAIMSHPSWMEIVKGIFFWGRIPDPPQWALADPEFSVRPRLLEITTTFGYIGGSMASYAIYANFTSLHGWGLSGSPEIQQIREIANQRSKPDYLPLEPQEIKKGLQHLVPMKYDVLIGMGVLLLVSWSFMIAGAAIMNPHQLLPSGYILLSKQKAIWQQISPIMVPIYYFSILTALSGVLYAIPGVHGRLIHEFGSVVIPRLRSMPFKKYSLFISGYFIVASIALLLSGIKPIQIMDFAALISTNIGIAILAIMALWANMILPKPYRPHLITFILGIVAILILSFFSYLSIANF